MENIYLYKRKQDPYELLFFIPWTVYLSVRIIANSFYAGLLIGMPRTMVILGCVALLLVRELLLDRLDTETALWAVFCAAVAFLFYRRGGISDVAIPVFVFAARNVDFKKTARLTAVTGMFWLLLIIFSAKAGWITDYFEFWKGRKRYYLGFLYGLYAPGILYNITALLICLRQKKIRWLTLAGLFAFNLVLYYLTDSRLYAVQTAGLLLLAGLQKLLCVFGKPTASGKKRIGKWFALLIPVYPVCAAGSILLTGAFVPYGFMGRLNRALGRRLYYGKNSLTKYGVSLFGKNITWTGNGLSSNGKASTMTYDFVDCLYIRVLQRYGTVFTVAVLVILTVMMYELYRRKMYWLMILFAITAVHGILDNLVFLTEYNTLWLAVAGIMDGKGEREGRSRGRKIRI